jgi:signal transduction histidine kinase
MLKAISKIRVRLVLGFIICFLGVSIFVGLSYRYFLLIDKELLFLGRAYSLVNVILEMRRYEKNYFLYHKEADFQEVLRYFDQLESLLVLESSGLKNRNKDLLKIRDLSLNYLSSFSALHNIIENSGIRNSKIGFSDDLINLIRASGHNLVALCEKMARKEGDIIQGLFRSYRILFMIFFITIIIIGGTVVYLLEVNVVKPLNRIEEATKKVAQGNFQPIPSVSSRDEIGSLVQSFNQMVVQLQKSREQMIQTEKLSALGTLTSGVAHELNNPLSNISTSCQILMEEVNDKIPEYHRGLLSSIEEQIGKARDIVRALLEFSREKEFELKPVELRSVVEDTLKLVKGDIPAHVHVQVEVPWGIILDLDKPRMEQALLNIIINGVQAMKEEGILTIQGFINYNSHEVILEVIDTGVGIPKEILPRIFDPFFTTKEVGRGTGLGLSVTYGIIENHGGKISVESELGKGTKVILRFPLKDKMG